MPQTRRALRALQSDHWIRLLRKVGYAYVKCKILESINAAEHQAGFVAGLAKAISRLPGEPRA